MEDTLNAKSSSEVASEYNTRKAEAMSVWKEFKKKQPTSSSQPKAVWDICSMFILGIGSGIIFSTLWAVILSCVFFSVIKSVSDGIFLRAHVNKDVVKHYVQFVREHSEYAPFIDPLED